MRRRSVLAAAGAGAAALLVGGTSTAEAVTQSSAAKAAQAAASSGGDVPWAAASLRDLAAKIGLRVGSALTPQDIETASYAAIAGGQFSTVTPANGMSLLERRDQRLALELGLHSLEVVEVMR